MLILVSGSQPTDEMVIQLFPRTFRHCTNSYSQMYVLAEDMDPAVLMCGVLLMKKLLSIAVNLMLSVNHIFFSKIALSFRILTHKFSNSSSSENTIENTVVSLKSKLIEEELLAHAGP